MEELTIGDKVYISSKRAAEITGYAKDYVGQLCREGRVEATLVGRSWYVLEDSIRAHRFGDAENKEPVSKENEEKSEAFDTWKSPTYKAEVTPEVPLMERRSVNVLNDQPAEVNMEPKTASIEDMQAAWKEWFATRGQASEAPEAVVQEVSLVQPEPVVESQSEPEQATEVEHVQQYVDPVPLTREIEEPVHIQRSYRTQEPVGEPVYVSPPVVPHQRARVGRSPRQKRPKGSSLAVRTLLITVALLSLAIAAVNSGFLDSYVEKNGLEYEPLRFLGGTRLISE